MPWFTPRARASRSPPRARAQRLDVLIGILGFFTVMAFLQAVLLEVRGEDAVVAVLTLVACLALLAWAYRARRRTGV